MRTNRRGLTMKTMFTILVLVAGCAVYSFAQEDAAGEDGPNQSGTTITLRPLTTTTPDDADDATEAAPAPVPDKVGTFLLIRIEGTIGANFTAKHMERALKEAQKLKPDIVVLYLDTPGGYIGDATDIIDMIIRNKDLRFVAYIRQAYSAGAAITLTCPEIYVEDVANIGAALCYQMINGMPTPVAEKFQSAWRATCRKAAENGGHPSILAEAMIDADMTVTMRTDADGNVIIERGGNGELLSAMGRILTLTARESVACGLAKALVTDMADMQAKLGFAKLTEVSTGEEFSLFASPDAEPDEGSAAALFLEIEEKITELGFDDDDMTDFQIEQALEEWGEYIEDEVFGRRITWTVSVLEVEEVDKESIEAEITYTRSRIRELEEYVTVIQPDPQTMREMKRWYKFQKRRIKRLKRTRSLASSYPYSLIAAGGGGRNVGCVIASVNKQANELMRQCAKGDDIVLRGEIEDLTFQRLGRNIYPVLWILKGRASAPEVRTAAEPANQQDDQSQAGARGGREEQTDDEKAERLLKAAKMYERAGKADKERGKLEELLEKYPDSASATAATERLRELGASQQDNSGEEDDEDIW